MRAVPALAVLRSLRVRGGPATDLDFLSLLALPHSMVPGANGAARRVATHLLTVATVCAECLDIVVLGCPEPRNAGLSAAASRLKAGGQQGGRRPPC